MERVCKKVYPDSGGGDSSRRVCDVKPRTVADPTKTGHGLAHVDGVVKDNARVVPHQAHY